MRAIVFDAYGAPDVLRLAAVEEPRVGDGDVLVEVRAASLNALDWHFVTGLPYVSRLQFGIRRPIVTRLGADLAGTVIAVGDDVTRFAVGDEVFGAVPEAASGRRLPELGSCAELVRATTDTIVHKPASVAFEAAAAVPTAGLTALQGLRDRGRLEAGQHVLVNGASGGVGTFAVQIAKWLGAEVTGVCSGRNVELVRSIGADHVVDYTLDDFATHRGRYDVMLDLVGNRSLRECRGIVRPGGAYLSSFGRPDHRWLGPMLRLAGTVAARPFVKQRLDIWVTRPDATDLATLAELLHAGTITPVIDRTYALSESAEAMRHLATERARGKVLITV